MGYYEKLFNQPLFHCLLLNKKPVSLMPWMWLGWLARTSSSEAAKFLPFGLGARFCPGAPLAMAQLRTYAAVLLGALQWRAEGRTAMDLSEAYSFTLTPGNPPRVIFALNSRSSVKRWQGRGVT